MKHRLGLSLVLFPLGLIAQSAPMATTKPVRAKQTLPATAVSPALVQLATNIEVIPSIAEAARSVGVETHEGRFGPLLFTKQTRAFYIQLSPGMFLGEHPHPTGSLVFTVRGRWVLASEGKRQVMEPGSMFTFGDETPTGWEAPFSEGALLLVVKVRQPGEDYASYMAGLAKTKADIEKERAEGEPFYFDQLKPDHPAVVFARSVNPGFNELLARIKHK